MLHRISKCLRGFPPSGSLAAILGALVALSGCASVNDKQAPENQDETRAMMRHMRPPGDHPEPFSFSNTGRSIEKDLGVE
jgi:hypothetical protein